MRNDKYIVVMRRSSLNELKEKKFDILEGRQDHQHRKRDGGQQSVWVSEQMLDRLRKTPSMRKSRSTSGSWPGRRSGRFKGRFEDSVFPAEKRRLWKKNTRVKARVKAHALKEFMNTKEKVVVMGHRPPDADSFGAGHRYLPCGENAE